MASADFGDHRAPSLLIFNARVIREPHAPEATVVATAGQRIAAVGGEEIRRLRDTTTEAIDCGGLLFAPGFIDAHIHILAAATADGDIDCSGANSIEELVALLGAAAQTAPSGTWVRGHGYGEMSARRGLAGASGDGPEVRAPCGENGPRRPPIRYELDREAPNSPLRIRHASGHASVLNSEGLRRLGIRADTEEPAGGQIVRDPHTGEPAGPLIEMEDLLDSRMPARSLEELEAGVHRFSARLLTAGVTSVQDLGHRNDAKRARLLANFSKRGIFRPAITLATGYEAFAAGQDAAAPGIRRGPVKIMLNESGEALVPEAEDLARRIREVHRAGRQVAVHAIEPRAIEAALDGIAAAQAEDGRTLRHRIEHAAITPPALARRIAHEQVVVVSNPAFLCEHGGRYLKTVPSDERRNLYGVAALRGVGVCVAAGSDCPVAPPEPSLGIYAARSRLTKSERRIPGETLGLQEAVALYTSYAAYAANEEREKGRIEPGFSADLVLLDDSGKTLRPAMTVLRGEVAWRSDSLRAESSA